MIQYLSHDMLNLSEFDVYEALIRWVKYKQEERQQELHTLLRVVRYRKTCSYSCLITFLLIQLFIFCEPGINAGRVEVRAEKCTFFESLRFLPYFVPFCLSGVFRITA